VNGPLAERRQVLRELAGRWVVVSTRVGPELQSALLRLSSLVVLVALIVFFGFTAPGWYTTTTLFNILTATALFLLLALGETFVIISSAIDLSVGSMEGLAGVASAVVVVHLYHGGFGLGVVIVGALAAVAIGAVGGALNGMVIGYLGLNSLIATLASYGAFLGFADVISNGFPIGNLPPAMAILGNGGLGGVPYLVLIAAGASLFCAWLASQTRWGRYVYAIGANREAVKRAGVDLRRHTVLLFSLTGGLAGLAGLLTTAKFLSASSEAGSTDLLIAIAAVVIGGTPLTGGEGGIGGTVVGALIITIIENGLVEMGVSGFWQLVVVGVIIVIAVYLDEYQRKLRIAAASIGQTVDEEGDGGS
jgi:ribose transport system permease protein